MLEVVLSSAESDWIELSRMVGSPVRVYLIHAGLFEGTLRAFSPTTLTIQHEVGFTLCPLNLVRVALGILESYPD